MIEDGSFYRVILKRHRTNTVISFIIAIDEETKISRLHPVIAKHFPGFGIQATRISLREFELLLQESRASRLVDFDRVMPDAEHENMLGIHGELFDINFKS
jgi:hypothetical protein